MDSAELQKLAQRTRFMREAGFALLIASALLAIPLLSPMFFPPEPAPIVDSGPPAPNAYANVPLEAQAAVVYDLSTNQVLFAKNADAQLPLASLTKLLTVYAALSELPPTALIEISSEAAQLEAPRAFNAGQIFSLADLARLTLTASLNDGAAAIIEATAAQQQISQDAALASAASALNLAQTYAVNGSGLDMTTTVSGGYGSALDLARLAGALVEKNPDIAAATIENTTEATSLGGTHFSVKNTDPMVDTIPHLLLSKTGFTDLAGGNLALVIDVGIGHPVAIVVLGSSQKARFTDGTSLVAATLAHFAGVASL